ncbi:MAG: hypothetical protein LBJ09_02145 [Clostridiales bacterium]|jgi:hypothetical protein|nr:hypothetical protein [Clostridiales bacterium]
MAALLKEKDLARKREVNRIISEILHHIEGMRNSLNRELENFVENYGTRPLIIEEFIVTLNLMEEKSNLALIEETEYYETRSLLFELRKKFKELEAEKKFFEERSQTYPFEKQKLKDTIQLEHNELLPKYYQLKAQGIDDDYLSEYNLHYRDYKLLNEKIENSKLILKKFNEEFFSNKDIEFTKYEVEILKEFYGIIVPEWAIEYIVVQFDENDPMIFSETNKAYLKIYLRTEPVLRITTFSEDEIFLFEKVLIPEWQRILNGTPIWTEENVEIFKKYHTYPTFPDSNFTEQERYIERFLIDTEFRRICKKRKDSLELTNVEKDLFDFAENNFPIKIGALPKPKPTEPTPQTQKPDLDMSLPDQPPPSISGEPGSSLPINALSQGSDKIIWTDRDLELMKKWDNFEKGEIIDFEDEETDRIANVLIPERSAILEKHERNETITDEEEIILKTLSDQIASLHGPLLSSTTDISQSQSPNLDTSDTSKNLPEVTDIERSLVEIEELSEISPDATKDEPANYDSQSDTSSTITHESSISEQHTQTEQKRPKRSRKKLISKDDYYDIYKYYDYCDYDDEEKQSDVGEAKTAQPKL